MDEEKSFEEAMEEVNKKIDLAIANGEELSFVVRSKEELYKKLEQARKSREEGRVHTLEEVFAELEKI